MVASDPARQIVRIAFSHAPEEDRAMHARWLMLLLLPLLLPLIGCEQKFSRARFQMIQPGVDNREDVEQMLGKPEARLADVWYYEDVDRNLHAQIFFDDEGRVLSKEWMDAHTGEWEGRSPYTDAPPDGEVRERSTRTRRFDD
jgi:hypothetical protein